MKLTSLAALAASPPAGVQLISRPIRPPRGEKTDRMRYHHLGIPTTTPQIGETYLKQFKLYCTDHEDNAFGIQWMRYEDDSPLPDLVKTVPHVAFEVDDLASALEGHEILIEPNSPSEGVLVAFVVCNGAPVEFLEFARPDAESLAV